MNDSYLATTIFLWYIEITLVECTGHRNKFTMSCQHA